jgi:alkanesulfonate monooxygenase SsuD/methylene tetrahydromethanopterin reductase-like flavin-dependent oxidoreductase (luciferase family)
MVSTKQGNQQPFGVMHQMWAMRSMSDADFLRETAEDIVLADQLGYDSVWIAEHHYVRDGEFYSRLPDAELFIASLIERTNQIRLATGIKLLILDHAERVAEKLALLHLLSDGRVIYGLGQGSPDELGVRSMTTDEKRLQFRSALEELAGYLTGGQVGGKLQLTPTAPVAPGTHLWAGVRDEESIAHAAKHGANMIVGESEIAVRQRPMIEQYRRSGGIGEARGARLVCVAETTEQALADVREPAARLHAVFMRGKYAQEAAALGLLDADVDAAPKQILEHLEYAVGTPEQVRAELESYIETTGICALNIMVHAPGIAQASAQRSLRMFMSDVAPALLPALAKNRINDRRS